MRVAFRVLQDLSPGFSLSPHTAFNPKPCPVHIMPGLCLTFFYMAYFPFLLKCLRLGSLRSDYEKEICLQGVECGELMGAASWREWGKWVCVATVLSQSLGRITLAVLELGGALGWLQEKLGGQAFVTPVVRSSFLQREMWPWVRHLPSVQGQVWTRAQERAFYHWHSWQLAEWAFASEGRIWVHIPAATAFSFQHQPLARGSSCFALFIECFCIALAFLLLHLGARPFILGVNQNC